MEQNKVYLPNHWEEDEVEEDLDSRAANNDVGASPPRQHRSTGHCCGDVAHDHEHHHHHGHEHKAPDASVFIPKPVQVTELEAGRLEQFFEKAWAVANSETMYGARQVLMVTPNRSALPISCPPPGFASPEMLKEIQELAGDDKKKVLAIGYTAMEAITQGLPKAVPFIGILIGLAYSGHSVVLFEGAASALACAGKNADIVVVDSEVIPFLSSNWKASLKSKSNSAPTLYVHNRDSYSLNEIADDAPAAASSATATQ